MRRTHAIRHGLSSSHYCFPIAARGIVAQASHTPQGIAGIQAQGGSSRRDAVAATAEALGGTVGSFSFAFGDSDVFSVLELPDNETATAIALTVNASGAVTVRTNVLLTPEETDAAAQRSVNYRAPGT